MKNIFAILKKKKGVTLKDGRQIIVKPIKVKNAKEFVDAMIPVLKDMAVMNNALEMLAINGKAMIALVASGAELEVSDVEEMDAADMVMLFNEVIEVNADFLKRALGAKENPRVK
jgi:hypothetical protein